MTLHRLLHCPAALALGVALALFVSGCRQEVISSAAVAKSPAAPSADIAASAEQPPAEPAPATPAESAPPALPERAQPADDSNPKAGATRPKADRTPRKPGEAEKITFDDLIIGMQANIAFRPWMMLDRPKELEGTRVRIPGYMHPGAVGTSGIKEFVLLRNKECKFGKDGQADHLTRVFLREGTKTDYIADSIVEGTLRIDPYTGTDGNTWSIYTLEDTVMR